MVVGVDFCVANSYVNGDVGPPGIALVRLPSGAISVNDSMHGALSIISQGSYGVSMRSSAVAGGIAMKLAVRRRNEVAAAESFLRIDIL